MACPGLPWAAAKTRGFRDLSNITIIPEHTMTKNYYIGLDVHKETIAIAYATGGTRDESVYHGSCGGSVLAAERALRKLAEKLGVEFSALNVKVVAPPPLESDCAGIEELMGGCSPTPCSTSSSSMYASRMGLKESRCCQ